MRVWSADDQAVFDCQRQRDIFAEILPAGSLGDLQVFRQGPEGDGPIRV